MRVRIFVSSGQTFDLDAPDGSDRKCSALPKDADRFEFWRGVTVDSRIVGHAMVWSVIE